MVNRFTAIAGVSSSAPTKSYMPRRLRSFTSTTGAASSPWAGALAATAEEEEEEDPNRSDVRPPVTPPPLGAAGVNVRPSKAPAVCDQKTPLAELIAIGEEAGRVVALLGVSSPVLLVKSLRLFSLATSPVGSGAVR